MNQIKYNLGGENLMKKTKAFLIVFLILCISIIPLKYVNAHSIELDENNLISFPLFIYNGKGTISISSSQTGYELYYQAVEIPNDDYQKMEEIKTAGKKAIEELNTQLNSLKAERDNLKTVYDEAYAAYQEKVTNNATEEEIATAKEAYETAKTNYQNKIEEYNDKVDEYNAKVKEINTNINAIVPAYVEGNWTKTEDGNFQMDLTQFSGNKAFAIWAKLVTSDGTIVYDEETYKLSGKKVEDVAVESISLDKTSISIAVGSEYTLVATVKPTDATNKSVIWTSDNEKVAKVEAGKVIAVSGGTATITATTADGNYTATCKVTVTQKAGTPNQDDNGNQGNQKDPTVADGKLPQTGSLLYIAGVAIIAVGIAGIVAYKKGKYLNFK